MKIILTNEQSRFLLDLCRLAGETKSSLAEKLVNCDASSDEIDEICELISNEFLMKGIEENFEPNNYGRELEKLLDLVNRERLRSS